MISVQKRLSPTLAVILAVLQFVGACLCNATAQTDVLKPYAIYYLYGTAGHLDYHLMYPKAMAFSPDGRLLAVSDTGNNRILVFSVAQTLNASHPINLELIIGDIQPWEGTLSPHDPPDAYREKDHFDGIRPTRTLAGRAYQGGQSKIRPWNKVPIDRFNLPQGIAWLDPKIILIADTGNHRIKAVRLNGEVAWILGQEGWKDGYFRYPLGLDTDKNGFIYVTEPRSKYIRGLGLDFLQRQRVQGNRLQIFDTQRKPVKRAGHMHHMSGRFERQYKDLNRICVKDNGEILLADNGNHRILLLDQELKTSKIFREWPEYKLRYPNGVHASANGRIVIADTGNHKVLILTPDGKLQQILGGPGTEPGRFFRPFDVKFGPHGDIYVLDTDNCRIQIFRGPYTKEYEWQPPVEPVIEPASETTPLEALELPPELLPKSENKFSY